MNQLQIRGEPPEQRLAKTLGFPDINHSKLRIAITHTSYLNENPESTEDYERLEYLGDAVLDFIVAEWLFNKFPYSDEGEMTKLRGLLVNTDILARFADDINLGDYILFGKGATSINTRFSRSVLAAVFEAILAVVYIEMGIKEVKMFLIPFIQKAVNNLDVSSAINNSKNALQEYVQEKGFNTVKYKIIRESGPDHDKEFTAIVTLHGKTIGEGQGKSKRDAEKIAAKNALYSIRNSTI